MSRVRGTPPRKKLYIIFSAKCAKDAMQNILLLKFLLDLDKGAKEAIIRILLH